jgi:UDP-glucuronate 4-epimerase
MLADQRILITGVTGKAVLPIARVLAQNNQVWGMEDVRAAGIVPCRADLDAGDLSELPAEVDYVLHFAWMRAAIGDLDCAIRVNVEGAGLILKHCQTAKAALVVSSQGIYSPNADPQHRYTETDPIGRGATAYAQTSPATKLGLEAVARFCGRAFDLPITIARLNTVLGPRKAYFSTFFDAVRHGQEIVLPGDPNCHSPIHTDDMIAQIEPLLDAAATRATIVNWCGDDVVTTQDSIARTSALLGIAPKIRVEQNQGVPAGNANDNRKRLAITGPCRVPFWTGFERIASEILAEPGMRAGA